MLNTTLNGNLQQNNFMDNMNERGDLPATNWIIWFIPMILIMLLSMTGIIYFWWRKHNHYNIDYSALETIQAELDSNSLIQEEYQKSLQYKLSGVTLSQSPSLHPVVDNVQHYERIISLNKEGIMNHPHDDQAMITRMIDPNTAQYQNFHHQFIMNENEAAPMAINQPNEILYRGIAGNDHGFDAPNVEYIKRGRIDIMQQINHQNVYFRVEDGLNYGGLCCNRKCKAYAQNICMQRGFGQIMPFTDIMEEYIVCPGCLNKFELEWFVLLNCDTKIEYQKVDNKCKILQFSPRGNEYISLGENDEDGEDEGSISTKSALYEKLVFYVSHIPDIVDV